MAFFYGPDPGSISVQQANQFNADRAYLANRADSRNQAWRDFFNLASQLEGRDYQRAMDRSEMERQGRQEARQGAQDRMAMDRQTQQDALQGKYFKLAERGQKASEDRLALSEMAAGKPTFVELLKMADLGQLDPATIPALGLDDTSTRLLSQRSDYGLRNAWNRHRGAQGIVDTVNTLWALREKLAAIPEMERLTGPKAAEAASLKARIENLEPLTKQYRGGPNFGATYTMDANEKAMNLVPEPMFGRAAGPPAPPADWEPLRIGRNAEGQLEELNRPGAAPMAVTNPPPAKFFANSRVRQISLQPFLAPAAGAPTRAPKAKLLTDENVARTYLAKAGGDRARAKAMAEADGYTVPED